MYRNFCFDYTLKNGECYFILDYADFFTWIAPTQRHLAPNF